MPCGEALREWFAVQRPSERAGEVLAELGGGPDVDAVAEGGVEDAAGAVALRPGEGEGRLGREQQVDARRIEVPEAVDLLEERVWRLERGRRRVRARLDGDADERLVGVRLELTAQHLDVLGRVVPCVA